MEHAVARKFGRLDAVVFAVATLLGLAWWRLISPRGYFAIYVYPTYVLTESGLEGSGSQMSLWHFRLKTLLNIPISLYPIFVTWTFALFFIRLLPPRPSIRRVARQPGFATTFSVVVAAGFVLIDLISKHISYGGLTWPGFAANWGNLLAGEFERRRQLNIAFTGRTIFLAVASTSSVMHISPGVSACKRSWVDRMGQTLGVIWIGTCLIRMFTL